MKAFRWIGLLLFVAVAGFALVQRKQARQLMAENQALRAQVQAVADLSAAADEAARQRDADLQRLRAEAQELVRLRGEVTQLRSTSKDAEKVRAENQRLASENQQWRTSAGNAQAAANAAKTSQESFSKTEWNFAGYATPEAALVSAIWSMKEGNPKTYLESLAPEEQARMAKVWENKTEAEIAAKHQSDVTPISAFRILERQSVNDNEVLMNIYIEGVSRMEKVSMKRVGNDWKFGGFVRPPAP